MGAITTRKVLAVGEGGGAICLPADWRRYHRLKPGDAVNVLYDSLLIIIPPGAEEKAREKAELIRKVLE
ncbi:MAG: AbrB/MazE/SpoVT family DNA-binding domain-containing protein [Candidatus Hadarchaeales archaeon]